MIKHCRSISSCKLYLSNVGANILKLEPIDLFPLKQFCHRVLPQFCENHHFLDPYSLKHGSISLSPLPPKFDFQLASIKL